MGDRKKKLHTKEKFTMETYDTPKKCNALAKGPMVEKVKNRPPE
jgi:hypothetical protein